LIPSNAPMNELGWAMIIRAIEDLYLRADGGSNDLNADDSTSGQDEGEASTGLSAAEVNSLIEDASSAYYVSMIRANGSRQSIAAGGALTTVIFDLDNDNDIDPVGYSTATGILTVPTSGVYMVISHLTFQHSCAATQFVQSQMAVKHNSDAAGLIDYTEYRAWDGTLQKRSFSASAARRCSAGDSLSVVFANASASGLALEVSGTLVIARLGS